MSSSSSASPSASATTSLPGSAASGETAQPDLGRLAIDKTGWQSPRRTPRRRWLWLLAAVLLAGVALGARMLFPAEREVRLAVVTRVYPTQSMTTLVSSGYVTAQRKASVASKITSRLEWLGVEEGSRVTAGQVLARLESDDARAALDRAQANERVARADIDRAAAELTDARRNHARMSRLLAENVISRSDLDTAETRALTADAAARAARDGLAAATAARREAETQLEYSFIRAPFDAVVLTKNADVGDIITPLGAAANAKASVVTIADMGSLLVETDVSESSVGRVRPGAPCEIALDALPDDRFVGRVHIIVPTADRSKASVMVKVAFDVLDPRVLPEMSARVSFLDRLPSDDERRPRPAVPATAVRGEGDARAVFVVRDGRAVRTPVRTGMTLGDALELLDGPVPGSGAVAGLTVGDRVVADPPADLADGARVRMQP
ncbi:efflux RND transporter periplasmic adaptor subunit [Nitratidesulfovibrio sp. SRB-5]|uniref:efflux RND transporter periplasmic adaptor subunit n=1 Tax=Nitratidesulfovibrio sp. SRB-5 TaxID=2872636 RepID=UPI0010283E17|nr:efflux RND transporter periplasmic adaptor subunit [Nitratidesulfovibrio sp. SRB-5]MBZ2173046.1 efflux RND transporter periplasmic adaptor subunit [Nitratidesulfovibrio sp. SRB-5]RXF76326.1 efflux RND transporter periplasmic adaptor subunit [Desulfovibrio sp. DS-1]